MSFTIGSDCDIHPSVEIDVRDGYIGAGTIIRAGARIEGNLVEIGRESYLDRNAWIGGGSCFDREAFLHTGDFFHMGWNSHVNIARGVHVGHEVGLGVETKVFTHGAYLPANEGFPVQWGPVYMGDRVWLPNAWVNPNVKIGSNTVVAARSLVNCNLEGGCLYGGTPATLLRTDCYPTSVDPVECPTDEAARHQLRRNGIRFRLTWDTQEPWGPGPIER